MFKSKRELPAYRMPTAEEFALWGARELTYEELLAVNGGRHVIDDPRTDDISDTIADGGHSPRGSESAGNDGSSGGSSGGSSSSGSGSSFGGTSSGGGSSVPPSSSSSEPVTGSDSDDTGEYMDYPEAGYIDYPGNGYTDGYENGGVSGNTGGFSGNSDLSGEPSSHDNSDDDYSSSDDSDNSYWGSGSSGGSMYTPPVQNQEPSAPSSPGAQDSSSPNTDGMPSVSQKPDVQAPAEPEPKKGWGEKISDWFKENKMIVGKIIDTFFKNDGAKTIHTIGVAASGTVTMVSGAAGAGIYINPKNDNLFNLSSKLLINANPVARTTGAVLTAVNIEDIGGYAGVETGAGTGVSGSLAMTAGSFKSKEDMAGLYYAMGLSGGEGLSGGSDIIFNMDGECIGTQASFGPGIGLTFLEGHTRWGVTGATSFMKKTVTAP